MNLPMAGLRPEQGPPLSVPVAFFLTAPLALGVAGAVLAWSGADGVGTARAATAVAVVHLGTAGLLLFVMLGALYQMLPVVSGAVVPAVRLAHGVHALLVAGAGFLVHGQATGAASSFVAAVALLSAALTLFLLPALWASARSTVKTPTARGMTVALLALGLLGFAGLRLAWARGGHAAPGAWEALRLAHAHLGLVAWVGGLITAVSWQVLPMFYLVAPPPPWVPKVTLAGVAATAAALAAVQVVDTPAWVVPLLVLPGALAAWGLQPLWALRALWARKRKRKDATAWFWFAAMGAGPVSLVLGGLAAWTQRDAWPLLYGLVVLWGWAGLLVHGMLMRILPFLVWLHWCAPKVGKARVPSMRELLPDEDVAVGFLVHVATLGAGVVAVTTGHHVPWRVFGGGLVVTGAWLGFVIVATLARGRAPMPPLPGPGP